MLPLFFQGAYTLAPREQGLLFLKHACWLCSYFPVPGISFQQQRMPIWCWWWWRMLSKYMFKILIFGTPLVAQWLRIHLPMQGTWVQALVREDPTCRRATKPVCHNYWARVPQLLKPMRLEPVLRSKRKPPQWEARTPQRRVAPARCN